MARGAKNVGGERNDDSRLKMVAVVQDLINSPN